MIIATALDLGTLVRNARLERHETQADVSRRAGISRDSLIRIEKGHPRAELAKALAVVEALGITLTSLGAEESARVDPSSAALLDSIFDDLGRRDRS